MRKIIVFNMVSVDGFFAGTDGDIGWHNVGGEFNEFAIKQMEDEVGLLMFGRATYELMAGYWPTQKAIKNDPIVAGLMNNADKIVFSHTMDKAEWNKTKLMKKITREDIGKLKADAGKDIFIFGSGSIVQQLASFGFIDEYRLMINPVALGSGKTLFNKPAKLKLIKAREFKNGNVLLCYRPNNP